jgi:ABC-type uncharacterized transport system substrate-binding protein
LIAAALLLFLAGVQPTAAQELPLGRKVVIVVPSLDAWTRPIVSSLGDAVGEPNTYRVVELSRGTLSDPIRRGRLEYAIGLADVVVPVGAAAADFVLQVNEGALVYFVGGADLSGRELDNPKVGGVLDYDIAGLTALAASEWPTRLGVAYTAGFEPLIDQVREAAEKRGVSVAERRLTGDSKADAASLGELLREAPALWIFGRDLNDGPAFEDLLRRARDANVALIAAGPEQVQKGALLCEEAIPGPLAEAAAAGLKSILKGARLALPSPRIASGPSGGEFVISRSAAERLKLDFSGVKARWLP